MSERIIHLWDLTDEDVQLLIRAVRTADDALHGIARCDDPNCPIRLALEALERVKPSGMDGAA